MRGGREFRAINNDTFFRERKKKGKRERKIRDSIFKRNEGLTSET